MVSLTQVRNRGGLKEWPQGSSEQGRFDMFLKEEPMGWKDQMERRAERQKKGVSAVCFLPESNLLIACLENRLFSWSSVEEES
jgi:hypothetical protein